MKRMIEFADKNNLEIVLASYSAFYNKYNPVERCWGFLKTIGVRRCYTTWKSPWNGHRLQHVTTVRFREA
jgi:hypothetical protein